MRRVATLQSAGRRGAGRNKCFEERNFSPCYYIGRDLLWSWATLCSYLRCTTRLGKWVSSMPQRGTGQGGHRCVTGLFPGEEMAPGTCYWRGVDPEDGHIFADVKNFGAPQEFLVLNGLFPRHPDHRLLIVGGGDLLSLEEE